MRLRALAVSTLLLSSSLAARAITIKFNNNGRNDKTLKTYTQGAFSVQNASGQFFFNNFFGNPAPSIFATGPASIDVTVTNGGNFDFTSADLVNDVDPSTFSFLGYEGGNLVYDVTGTIPTDPTGQGVFRTFDSDESKNPINLLVIETTGSDVNIDDVVVARNTAAVTPEPSSFVLLGSGLLGVAGVMRRRLA